MAMSVLDKVNLPDDLKNLSLKELKQLAEEIREFLIETVSKTGGHLAPNLGIVELTIALHRVFDLKKDRVIWDVGHQSYVHKILTGRKHLFSRLRQLGGLSGYPSPKESPYDVIHAGHSSTSISIATGLAEGYKIKGITDRKVIVVIGDGAMNSGMVWEAMNHLAHTGSDVLIILNDNGMSISKNVGGLAKYLLKIRMSRTYAEIKKDVETFLNKIPVVGKPLTRLIYRLKQVLTDLFFPPGRIFTDIGFKYFGPADGHNIKELEKELKRLKELKVPRIFHIITRKGKGYKPAEDNPSKFHGVGKFDIETGEILNESETYSDVFGEKIAELGEKHKDIALITPAMLEGAKLGKFAEKFPDRFFDVGIAEQHAVDFALGLSKAGLKPFLSIYSTFLQRGYDQVIHDIAISNANIVIAVDRAGIVGGDGETHQGVFDVSFLTPIPNITIISPAFKEELEMAVEFSYDYKKSPIVIRYPKAKVPYAKEFGLTPPPIEYGKAWKIKDGKDLWIITYGYLTRNAIISVKEVEKELRCSIGILHLRFLKPIDEKAVNSILLSGLPILILEEGVLYGGIRERILAIAGENTGKQIFQIGIGDEFPETGTREELIDVFNLSVNKICDKMHKILRR